MASAVWTTCAAVRIFPSADTRTPEPIPSTLARRVPVADASSFSCVRITTTDGSTFLKTSDRLSARAETVAAPIRTAHSRITFRALIVHLRQHVRRNPALRRERHRTILLYVRLRGRPWNGSC